MRARTLGTALLLCLSAGLFVAGCSSAPATTTTVPVKRTAVYVAPNEDASLDAPDLAAHPQVVVVHDQAGLTAAVTCPVAIWIDKNAARKLDSNWIAREAGEGYPIAVIGTANEILAFGDLLSFIMSMPPEAWTSRLEAKPGFAVWLTTNESATGFSATHHEYPGTPAVDAVLKVTDKLLQQSPLLRRGG